MYNKKLFILIAAGLLGFATVIGLVQVWGVPLKDVLTAITIYILFGVLVISYLLRIALVFIGVYWLGLFLQKKLTLNYPE